MYVNVEIKSEPIKCAKGLVPGDLLFRSFRVFERSFNSGLAMKTRSLVLAIGALALLSVIALAESRRFTDAEKCEMLLETRAYFRPIRISPNSGFQLRHSSRIAAIYLNQVPISKYHHHLVSLNPPSNAENAHFCFGPFRPNPKVRSFCPSLEPYLHSALGPFRYAR